jgi:hypothetical protein
MAQQPRNPSLPQTYQSPPVAPGQYAPIERPEYGFAIVFGELKVIRREIRPRGARSAPYIWTPLFKKKAVLRSRAQALNWWLGEDTLLFPEPYGQSTARGCASHTFGVYGVSSWNIRTNRSDRVVLVVVNQARLWGTQA